MEDLRNETAKKADEQRLIIDIKNVMESFGVTTEKAMDSLKIPRSQRSTYEELVGKRPDIPQFLEGEPLPAGYFEEQNPYETPATGKINLMALGEYVRKTGKKSGWELTKEEMKTFESE